MKKKLLIGAGVLVFSCIAVLGGILNGSPKVYAGGEMVYDRSPIFGFTASAGDVYLQMNRDNIETQFSKGSTSVILAQYTLSNGGPSNIELNAPAFYALADRPFILDKNVRNIVLSTDSDIPAVVSGNRIQFLDTVTVSPFSTITFYLMGDVSESAPVSSLVFEPDFTSPEFVINYADEMGNDGQLAPFNLVGDTQALKLSATGGLTDVFTASNVDYAKYYYSIKGTLTSPYIPEGAIMRNEAGIDVYIAKYKNNKRFKRLILSPSVFKSYGHLKWENVLIVNDAVMESYITSDYVFVAGEDKIWRLEPQGDTGTKREFEGYGNPEWAFDTDGLYEINTVDRDSYVTGAKIER